MLAEFLEVYFDKCDFTDVYLSGSNLSGSNFNQCIFKNNIFRKGQADYAVFKYTNIKNFDSLRTSFYESDFDDLVVENSMMKNCFMARARFSNVIFKRVDLTYTCFKYSGFNNIKFIECILGETIFDNAFGMERVEFIDCKK